MYELTKEEQEVAMQVAMDIENGIIQYDTVLNQFAGDKIGSAPLIHFWYNACEMTRQLVENLYMYKARKHLEKCLRWS